MYFDTHVHADFLPHSAWEELAMSGVRRLLSVSFVPRATAAVTLLDHFDALREVYRPQAEGQNIRLDLAFGIHPLSRPEDWQVVLDLLPERLKESEAAAIGEVGLHWGGALEEEVLFQQLRLAAALNLPVVMHTPPRDRREIVGRELNLVEKAGCRPDRVVIDHADESVLDLILSAGAVPGITARPGSSGAELLQRHPAALERAVLNSDYHNLLPRDYLGVPRLIQELRREGMDPLELERVMLRNAVAIFGEP